MVDRQCRQTGSLATRRVLSEAGAVDVPEHRTGTDIWYVGLCGDSRAVARHTCILSEQERKRAAAFRVERDAVRYVLAHGAMREILARYVRRDPRDLDFQGSPSGKPALSCHGEATEVWFNLAHSADMALLAVSREADVGIDIERINPSLDLPAVARRCFSRAEHRLLQTASPARYVEDFFTLWTRKEAYVKGSGEGLSAPLTDIDVSASPSFPGGGWIIRDLPVPAEYKGAIAVRSAGRSHRSYVYEDLAS